MTTPAPPGSPPPQQPSPFQVAADTALVAAVGTALLSAVNVAAAMPLLYAALKARRIPARAMEAVLDVVMSFPPGQTGAHGPATLAMERANLLRRAQFVVAAARRVAADVSAAHSRGQSVPEAITAALRRERRFYAQHLMAIWQRSQAGAQVDSAAMEHGLLLGWHATRDTRTSAECLAADGRNFYADHVPLIGYPGTVHPHCRCQAGRPFPGARLLPSHGIPATSRYRKAA